MKGAHPTIKVGMLGAGFILKSHATAVAQIPNCSLHMIADVAADRARDAAERYGFAHVGGSVEDMAASDCDVVHILLPPAHHIEAARAMVAAGKSVFLEKPMGIDSASCSALCDEAGARGLYVGVNHNFLFGRRYETFRSRIKSGEIGRIDDVSVDWFYDLPQMRTGPFDTWMLAASANVLFEIAPHALAFVVDLIGTPEIELASAGDLARMPNGALLPRRWKAVAHTSSAGASVNLSLKAGQAERVLRVRGRGGSLVYDFGRDFGWTNQTTTDNPVLDAFGTARKTARTIGRQALCGLYTAANKALKKQPDSSPFEATVFRSIRAFYEGGIANVDPRHQGTFAVDIIKLCEGIAKRAGAGRTAADAGVLPTPKTAKKASILVIGGTGFIGRKLVQKLCKDGHGVRVLSRSASAAAFHFADMPVEIMAGSHGDPTVAAKAVTGIDTIFHLAKCEGKRWQDYMDGDIAPTKVLGKAALDAGTRRFIYTGTIDSYASDDVNAVIDCSTPVDGRIETRNHYARSKAACEAELRALGLPLVIMRPAIVVGPGCPPAHLGVARFTSETRVEFWGDGKNPIPLVSVCDVAEALVLAIDAPDIEGGQFLLTSPPLLSASEYVEAFETLSGGKVEQIEMSPLSHWLADWAKEALKNAIRHPNRRWPTLHDWACKSHRSRYDASESYAKLGWFPVSDRKRMIDEVISPMVSDYFA